MFCALRHACQLVLLGAGLSVLGSAYAAVPEHELKLAITYNVTRFVEWPDSSPEADRFVFCIYRENPFAEAIEQLDSRSIQGNSIDVEILRSRSEINSRCHLVFIPESAADEGEQIAAELRSLPILTISDSPGFAAAGGIIELKRESNQIGFRINTDALRASGLTIGSQLLELAEIVTGD